MQKNLSLTTAGPLGKLFGSRVCAQLSIYIYKLVTGGVSGVGGRAAGHDLKKKQFFAKKMKKICVYNLRLTFRKLFCNFRVCIMAFDNESPWQKEI